jgi:hypothetical protein
MYQVQVIWPTLPKKLSRLIIKDYFDKFKEFLMLLDIKNKYQIIYNFDGKGFRFASPQRAQDTRPKGSQMSSRCCPQAWGIIFQ